VIQPRWVPRLSLTVDYYDFTVDNIITAPTAQTIANSCYDPADARQRVLQFVPAVARAGTGTVQRAAGRDRGRHADPGAAQLRQADAAGASIRK
jgi:hypothetical protein